MSVTTSVHAVESPGLPPENLRADAPGTAELQCALKGGRPLPQELGATSIAQLMMNVNLSWLCGECSLSQSSEHIPHFPADAVAFAAASRRP
jgi:hypothetical protein